MATHAAKQGMTGSRRPAGSDRNPVLASKITAPDVPDWALPRPRITNLVTQGLRWSPLVIVTGPVGAGKTMAVASWAEAEPGPVAWVSLDEFDNRPGVFWSCVVAALRRSGIDVPRELRVAVRGRSAEHLFLLRLAATLAAQNPPVTLVIDDFHLLTEPKVLTGLDFLLRNVGSGLRLVLVSRTEPRLPLYRYRLGGRLAEVRGSDLAFSADEAGLLVAQHGCVLSADSLDCLMRQTEGLAAGLRLAAISMTGHPDPDQFVNELTAEDSPLTGYLVQEVIDIQPPEIRELLLSTSILEHVNAETASELTGNEQAGRILSALAQANAFVQPIGGGWYRYHNLLAEALRLKLRWEHPDRIGPLRRQAARWYERNGQLTDAVRQAVQAGDWQLAAEMIIDGLAISEIIEPRASQSLAEEFAGMPDSQTWTEAQPYLVSAAVALSGGRPGPAAAALNTAEGILERRLPDPEAAARLAAAMIRLATARRAGDLTMAVEAAARAEALVGRLPGDMLARHPEIRGRVLSARGAAELWSGCFDEAARVLDSGVSAAAAAGDEYERICCLGHLALAEALRGRLGRAAKLTDQMAVACTGGGQRPPVGQPNAAALAALAWVHVEHHQLSEARSWLLLVDAALRVIPDKLVGAVACLMAARGGLAEGNAKVALRFVARARSGWSVPAWLEQWLNQAESRALAAVGDVEAALAAAKRADRASSPEAAVTLANAWLAAGDGDNARRALESALTASGEVPERVRMQLWLADSRLSYRNGDRARGRRSMGYALRLAEREQLRLPFAIERGWIGPVLERDPELARAHRELFAPAMSHGPLPAPPHAPDQDTVPAVEPLTDREQQVLRHVAGMLTTAEIASELYISANTVKSHIKNICHKLAVDHRGEAVRRARQLQLI
jgi:LuxR family maltose regulon positive regulatory protein